MEETKCDCQICNGKQPDRVILEYPECPYCGKAMTIGASHRRELRSRLETRSDGSKLMVEVCHAACVDSKTGLPRAQPQ